jgi:hypothetical protein
MARPESSTGLTRELADAIIEARKTMPRRFAATSNGVSPRTFKGWMDDGASGIGDPMCVYLAREIHKFEGQDIGEEFGNLKRIASVNPAAGEAYLKLMYPEDFGGHVRTAPDEFSDSERAARNRDKLLDAPPPRMLAELRKHRWLQMPAGMTKGDLEAIHSILAKYTTPLLAEPEKADE